jgi:hypothetical protein
MIQAYIRALQRDDVSHWLVHLTTGCDPRGAWLGPLEVVRRIVAGGCVLPSQRPEVLRHDPRGASSFYEVPPSRYRSLIETNPNRRVGFGLIVSKSVFWWKGGRPAIYSDRCEPERWHQDERFRLIFTDLNRQPQPTDWTHEREWRIAGSLSLAPVPNQQGCWWWPCVETAVDARNLFAQCPNLSAVYTLETNTVLSPGAA